jgi:hypothetical protein
MYRDRVNWARPSNSDTLNLLRGGTQQKISLSPDLVAHLPRQEAKSLTKTSNHPAHADDKAAFSPDVSARNCVSGTDLTTLPVDR